MAFAEVGDDYGCLPQEADGAIWFPQDVSCCLSYVEVLVDLWNREMARAVDTSGLPMEWKQIGL